jgi:hypothetical protein
MEAKKAVVILAVGVALGVITTPSPDPPDPITKFKFIKGPTKYITKKVPEKVITQPPVVMDWPASCNNALTTMKSGTHKANSIYNSARDYFIYIDKVQVSRLDSPVDTSAVLEWLASRKEKVRGNMQDLAYDVSDLESSLAACQKSIQKAQEDARRTVAGD